MLVVVLWVVVLAVTAIAAPVLSLGFAGTMGFLAVTWLAAGAFVALSTPPRW